jgi:hypothetical protein
MPQSQIGLWTMQEGQMPDALTIISAIVSGLFWTLHNKGYRNRFFTEKRGRERIMESFDRERRDE